MNQTRREKIRHDLRRIDESFYKNIDETLATDAFRSICSGDFSRVSLLGAGCHFESFRVNPSGNSRIFDQPFVLSIPHRHSHPRSEAGSIFYQKWYRSMERLHLQQELQKERIPLIPPFLLLRIRGTPLWLTPEGKPGADNPPGDHWLPLESLLEEAALSLKSAGLRLEDTGQISTWKQIPFIHDLSGLQSLSP